MDPTSLSPAPTTPTIRSRRDGRQAQVAALIALLRQPGAKWLEITADVVADGSAVDILQKRLGAEGTQTPEMQAVAQHAHNLAIYKAAAPSVQAQYNPVGAGRHVPGPNEDRAFHRDRFHFPAGSARGTRNPPGR